LIVGRLIEELQCGDDGPTGGPQKSRKIQWDGPNRTRTVLITNHRHTGAERSRQMAEAETQTADRTDIPSSHARVDRVTDGPNAFAGSAVKHPAHMAARR